MRPSWGVRACSSRSATGSAVPGHANDASFFSIDRSAFCNASGRLRPMAMASPTLFMCVVSVGSAAGNFSNANLGTLTTT
jgi:hypothetical protein